MKSETKDEPVNGPKVAAEILNRMRPEAKEKIVSAIHNSDPTIAEQIKERLYNFDDLTELTPQGVQALLKEVSQQDLVLSLKTASEAAKVCIFQNMSERKQQIVQSEFATLPPVRLSDIQEAQRRILRKLDELRTSGAVRTASKHEAWV